MNGLSKLAEPPIFVPDRALIEELISLPLQGSANIEFRAGISSRARVLLDYDTLKAGAERSVECDLYLEAGACIDVFHVLQEEDRGLKLNAKIRYHLKKHASLNVWTYVGGAELSRIGQQIFFEEEHGFASLRGLSLLDGRSESYHQLQAFHAKGYGISRQFYKSVLAGEARSGFDSLVSVAKDASHSDSKQLNKNLILSPSARAYSRPELRIQTDDVSCSHGSATGELSEDELFYLRSRGLSRDKARFMMIEGFAEEILEDESFAPLKERLTGSARKKIARLME